ncbi:MAG: CBS domain-containing protein [Armatimonadetes bacterium]|nr:CBS domain-containing protein [Armatimonadota bacterium]
MLADLGEARSRDWMVATPIVTPRTTVATALRLIREQGLPALPVCEGSRFLGLVTEKALLRLTPSEATTLDVYEQHAVLEKLTVARATVPAGGTVAPDAPLVTAAALMSREGVEALPVVEGGRLIGLLIWTALLAAAAGQPYLSRAG